MAQDHKDGNQPYESGGGAYEFPPLEKQGNPPGPIRFRGARPNHPHRWPPAFGAPGHSPGGKGGSAAPFAVVGVLASLIFAVLVAWGEYSSDSGASATSRAMPTPSAAPTTTGRSTTTAPATTAQSAAVIASVLPGYQGVEVAARGIAYDVPVGWTVDSPSVIRGFEGETGRISGTGAAVDGEDYCGENNRALAFVSRAQEPDHAATATKWGASTAELAYHSSGWTRRVTGPEPLTTRSGITGWMAETSGNQTPDPAECATEYSVYTFVFPGTETPGLILTLAADRGVPGEVTPEQAREIFGTVRFLG